MAKITMNEPGADGVETAGASAPVTITKRETDSQGNPLAYDAKGRAYGIRTLTALDKFRLKRVLGGDDAMNMAMYMDVLAVCSCASIDGEPEQIPATVRQIEALIAQLGDDGMLAVYKHLQAEQGLTEADIEAAKK